jgi:predicted DNA-binding transcriptional regulator AlpA
MDTNFAAEPLVNAARVSKHLHLAKSTIYDQAAKGLLPHVRLWSGTRRAVIRFRMSEVEAFIAARTVRPAVDVR